MGEREKEERRRAGDAITSRRRGASSCSRQFSIAHWLNACIHAWGDGARRARRQHECEEELRAAWLRTHDSLEGYLLGVVHDEG